MPSTSNKNTHPVLNSGYFSTQADVLDSGKALLETLSDLTSEVIRLNPNFCMDDDYAHTLRLANELIIIGLGIQKDI